MATQSGLDAGDYAAIRLVTGMQPSASTQGAVNAAAWDAVIDLTMNSLIEGLSVSRDAGLPPPDEVGYELDMSDEVIAEAELVWVQRRLVLLMPAQEWSLLVWQKNGWQVIVADSDWQIQLAKALAA